VRDDIVFFITHIIGTADAVLYDRSISCHAACGGITTLRAVTESAVVTHVIDRRMYDYVCRLVTSV